MIYSQLSHWNITHKRVFLRADLNVPLEKNSISNDFRLQSILPTLNYLLKHNTMIILATHIGNPKGYQKDLSTELLIPWFKKHNYTISFASTPAIAQQMPFIPQRIILLENLRFFPGEKQCDPIFAKQLAQTADYYVNDAFGALHRNDCSISTVPYEFTENKRTIGFLIEKELHALDALKHNAKKPFVAIVGGGKIEDKIPLIQGLISIADTIMICPALSFSFLAATGHSVGTSLISPKTFEICKKILHKAQEKNVKLLFPLDYQITTTDINGPLKNCDSKNIPNEAFGIAIGPKTVHLFEETIKAARTIFFNCAMGFSENPVTQDSTKSLLKAASQSKATLVIAGGDTIDIALDQNMNIPLHCLSTGGGAALAYLSTDQLPGLIPFQEHSLYSYY